MYITSQENEQAKTRFVHDLRHLLKDIPDFSPGNESDELVKSMKSLQENLQSYCSVHDITTPTDSEKQQLRAAKNSTDVDDIIDLPIVTNNSTVPTTVTNNSTAPTTVTYNSTAPTAVTNNSTASTTVTNNSTAPTTVTNNSTAPTTVTNNSTVPTTVTNNSTAPTNNSTVPTTVTNLETVDSIKNYVTIDTSNKENASQNVIKPLPLIPPPPIIVNENHVISHDLLINQDSDCSSHSGKSLLQEITTHERDVLHHVPQTPGGTPVRRKILGIRPNNHAEILQKALIKKFRTMHVHSTPKHSLGDRSVSMEISSTWSECDGNSDNHHYASDPDLTRTSDTDFSYCPQQLSVRSAADFGSSFSSPSLQDNS